MAEPPLMLPSLNDGGRKAWAQESEKLLICRAIYAETHDVKTFVFAPSPPARIEFEPGQFLTFTFPIGGEDIQRCYTISSAATVDATLSITVKLVPGGRVSPWLHAEMQVGDKLRVEGPNGQFTPDCVQSQDKYLFLSGGSGITPLISMTRTFADLAEDRDIIFLHAARTPRDIILRDELARLSRRLPRLRVVHIVEARDGEPAWPGYVGRVDASILRQIAPDLTSRAVLCCGPAPFMQKMKAFVLDAGLAPEAYAEESFDFGALAALDTHVSDETANEKQAQSYLITFAKMQRSFPCESGMTILEAAKRAGVPLAFGCAKGICGTCKSRKLSGSINMKHGGGIRQREIDNGYFLPCCSLPLEDVSIDR